MENINNNKIEELRKIKKAFQDEIDVLNEKRMNTLDEKTIAYEKLIRLDTYCPNLINRTNKSYGAKLGHITKKINNKMREVRTLNSMINGMLNGGYLLN